MRDDRAFEAFPVRFTGPPSGDVRTGLDHDQGAGPRFTPQCPALLPTRGATDPPPETADRTLGRIAVSQNRTCDHVAVRGIEELEMLRDAEPALMRSWG